MSRHIRDTRSGNLNTEAVFRNERHDLDRVFSVEGGRNGRTWTLRDKLAEGGPMGFRSDIILVNARRPCGCDGCDGTVLEQFALYADSHGTVVGDTEAFNLIAPADLAWAREEAQAMLATAEECPAFGLAFLQQW